MLCCKKSDSYGIRKYLLTNTQTDYCVILNDQGAAARSLQSIFVDSSQINADSRWKKIIDWEDFSSTNVKFTWVPETL